jgi:excisionase family DNA binding protein
MAVVREKLLTASDLATLCEVDLKTIHNWVDRGRIAHFRTPGRHLRFRAADVADFLRAWGYAVPRELARAGARTVLVVGSKDTLAHVTRALEGAPTPQGPAANVPIKHAKHAYDALVYTGSDPADVVIVDARAAAAEIEVAAMLEAMHRASPQATFIALADDGAELPGFVTRVDRNDAAALRTAALPGAEVPTPEEAAARAAGGAGR